MRNQKSSGSDKSLFSGIAKNYLPAVIIAAVFLLSFLTFSSVFYPAYNSDNAVTVLMIHYFRLPHDLYFWGQDRMGSLIPLLAQLPFRFSGMSAIWAEAVTHYLILFSGYLAFASLFRSSFSKIIFALVWFFPPLRMADVLQLCFGIHYSLIAICCFLVIMIEKYDLYKQKIFYYTAFSAIILLMTLAIWVNDMAVVSIACFSGMLIYESKRKIGFKGLIRKPELYLAIAGVLMIWLFINYAKGTATVKFDYSPHFTISTVKQIMVIFLKSLIQIFTFTAREPFTSVWAWMVSVFVLYLIISFRKIRISEDKRKWILFFTADAVLMFLLVIVSEWTLLNNVPRRYFTTVYISVSVVLLLLSEDMVAGRTKTFLLRSWLVASVLIAAAGVFYNLKYVWPRTLIPAAETASEFKKLGDIGLIADYWNSYVVSSVDPSHITATPHDKTWAVRNPELAVECLKHRNIYIVRDMWMENFPDTLSQFGHQLVKTGPEFKTGNCFVCLYHPIEK